MTQSAPIYSLHERVWHWLQAAAIVALILTGFQLHYPDRLPLVGSMANAVHVHSWLGLALIANAFLGLFYHFTAEKYHHFLPRMDDFTTGAVRQLHFYLYGIFKGEPHPFEADAVHKLNPIQKLTYLALLNVLLPFQLATGLLLWGANRWPARLASLGGLAALAPAHTLGAYLLVAFLVVHLYLTTTGSRPLSLIKAMVTGSE
jgi:Ni/Fe-hydrogenase b-type cytochrome subunit